MKSIKIIIVTVFTISALIFPQNFNKTELDSLYNHYMNLRFPSTQIKNEALNGNLQTSGIYEKCGLGISNEIRANFNSFSPNQQDKLKKILVRPTLDSSIVSPSGKFRIHFNTTGTDTIKYSLNDLAIALDSSYNFEINILGYPEPPTDGVEGGDSLYDIYVLNLGILYGETDFDKDLGNNRFTTYILIDDDFAGYFTEGINAARVTAAHELHHAIQVGNYIWRSTDRYFYELTSTAMEEIVYPTINDYFQYLNTYFNNPQISFANTNGYELGLWHLFLKSEFGASIIKRQWELMVSNNAINSISNSLIENNSNFALALNEFGLWTFFTNFRAQSGKYFDDAALFPLVRPVATIPVSTTNDTVNFTSQPLANNYIKFVNSTTSDSIDVIITNSDVISGSDNLSKIFNVKYILFPQKETGATKISDNYYSKLVVSNLNFWRLSEFVNGQLVTGSIGDFVWNDINKNGIQDTNEVGIENVVIKLLDVTNNDAELKTTITDSLGLYSFKNLSSGTYKIKFTMLNGFIFSPKKSNSGNSPNEDSDADLTTGLTDEINLAGKQNINEIDAGLYKQDSTTVGQDTTTPGFIYPNPFSYNRASNIFVPVINKNTTQATLNIYSASLTLLFSKSLNVVNVSGKNYVNWNGKQLNNERLPSGVYIYVTKVGDELLKGKLVIFNE